MSDGPVTGGLWARLRAAHPDSGLWPVLLDDTAQPWSAGQIAPEPVTEIDGYDPAAFMAEVWVGWAEPPIDIDAVRRLLPGPAPPGEPLEDPGAAADRYAADGCTGRPLGLVPAGRGADVLAAIGWQGARHHNPLTAPLSAVLRGWEDRFGARVVGIGFDTLDLSVAAPPAHLPARPARRGRARDVLPRGHRPGTGQPGGPRRADSRRAGLVVPLGMTGRHTGPSR